MGKQHIKYCHRHYTTMIASFVLAASIFVSTYMDAFTVQSPPSQKRKIQAFYHCNLELHRTCNSFLNNAVAGADIDQPSIADEEIATQKQQQKVALEQADIPTTTTSNILNDNSKRGIVNEIDYCIAPADVSLSRAYGTASTVSGTSSTSDDNSMVGLSLTRALNNASNRAVRRILLSRSWPSVDVLNRSLRQVAAMEAAAREEKLRQTIVSSEDSSTDSKCPVPRPILNVLTGKSKSEGSSNKNDGTSSNEGRVNNEKVTPNAASPSQRNRTDEQYVADQIQSFRNTYGALMGYNYAEEYLQCVLALATSGIESSLVPKVMSDGVYDEAYRRILSVLQTVGVEFVVTNNESTSTQQRRIADKMIDQDICLSVLDKIQMRNGYTLASTIPAPTDINPNGNSVPVNEKDQVIVDTDTAPDIAADTTDAYESRKKKFTLNFWSKKDKKTVGDIDVPSEIKSIDQVVRDPSPTTEVGSAVLLSNEDPTMTRQLNKLSNIVQRVLLFGGDQELLVVAETLTSDLPTFTKRWYPNDTNTSTRPGVDYMNCMIQLLRNCYNNGVVTDLDPPIPLPTSYANSYERLVASAVELGSGYLKPIPSILQQAGNGSNNNNGSSNGVVASNKMENNIGLVTSIPKPRTAQEELGRFAILESNFRQAQQLSSPSSPALYSPYPMDLVGQWEVRDEISGEIIGSSFVTFLENGNVQVPPPLEGLRWRLDPGPTHLDTCTFQVLSSIDRTILQYRGFIDRGARLEARFSKRPIRIRGSVMFQMRDGGTIDYYKDMLPINYRTGTTKFVMTKIMK